MKIVNTMDSVRIKRRISFNPITLSGGEERDDVHAGMFKPITIGNKVWNDLNGNELLHLSLGLYFNNSLLRCRIECKVGSCLSLSSVTVLVYTIPLLSRYDTVLTPHLFTKLYINFVRYSTNKRRRHAILTNYHQ